MEALTGSTEIKFPATETEECRFTLCNFRQFQCQELFDVFREKIKESLTYRVDENGREIESHQGEKIALMTDYKNGYRGLYVSDGALFFKDNYQAPEIIFTAAEVLACFPEFTNLRLKSMDLSGVDFSGKEIKNVIFSEIKMPEANFKHAVISNAEFDSVYMPRADFRFANISGTTIKCSYIQHAQFSCATIRLKIDPDEEYFNDFSHADFKGAKFNSSIFKTSIAFKAVLDDQEQIKRLNAKEGSDTHQNVIRVQRENKHLTWKIKDL